MIRFQEALHTEFQQLRSRNAAFSLRAYAKRLKVNSGVLSSVLSGKRKVSAKWAKSVVERMNLSPEDKQKVLQELSLKDLTHIQLKNSQEKLLLKSDEFKMISDGIHYALLALMTTDDFKSDVDWMAERLKTNSNIIDHALERLKRLHLAELKNKKRWTSTGKVLRTSDGISDIHIKNYHEDRLKEAKESLFNDPVDSRDFLSSTIAIDKSKLPMARKLTREYLMKLEALLSESKKDEVYRIGFQMFPITKISQGKIK